MTKLMSTKKSVLVTIDRDLLDEGYHAFRALKGSRLSPRWKSLFFEGCFMALISQDKEEKEAFLKLWAAGVKRLLAEKKLDS